MNTHHVRWLYGELPGLVRAGVLPAEAEARLRAHYGELPAPVRRNYGVIICAVLGTVLIGLGVILLFAHNWEELGRPARTALSFAPLLAAQAAALWTLLRRRDSVPWREGSAVAVMAGVGACIALISQTYNIPGNLASYLFTWMLLSAPLVYVLGATAPAVFYWVGITFWAGFAQDQGGHALLFWPMALVMAPHAWRVVRVNPDGIRAGLLAWAAALCLCVATGITLEKALPGLWTVVYAALFSAMYLAGSGGPAGMPSTWRMPLRFVGASGVTVVGLILTFADVWERVGWLHYRTGGRYHEWAALQDYVLAVGLLGACVALLVRVVRTGGLDRLPLGVAGVLAALAWAAVSQGEALETNVAVLVATLLFNLYLFTLGGLGVVRGIRTTRLATMNGGLLTLTLLITARFFDADLPFTVRGVAFIIIGAGFLGMNLWVRRLGDAK